MKKNFVSLACPYCNCTNGTDLNCKQEEEQTKEEREKCTIITTHRFYNCECKICNKKYKVDQGISILTRYYPFTTPANDDIKLYVVYKSEFDRSYRIAEVNEIPMIIMDDDPDPIIINNDTKEELVDNHREALSLTYNTWMNRHR